MPKILIWDIKDLKLSIPRHSILVCGLFVTHRVTQSNLTPILSVSLTEFPPYSSSPPSSIPWRCYWLYMKCISPEVQLMPACVVTYIDSGDNIGTLQVSQAEIIIKMLMSAQHITIIISKQTSISWSVIRQKNNFL